VLTEVVHVRPRVDGLGHHLQHGQSISTAQGVGGEALEDASMPFLQQSDVQHSSLGVDVRIPVHRLSVLQPLNGRRRESLGRALQLHVTPFLDGYTRRPLHNARRLCNHFFYYYQRSCLFKIHLHA
jgi:hypothetical protein